MPKNLFDFFFVLSLMAPVVALVVGAFALAIPTTRLNWRPSGRAWHGSGRNRVEAVWATAAAMLPGGRPLDDAHVVAQRVGRMEDDRLPGFRPLVTCASVALRWPSSTSACARDPPQSRRPPILAATEEAADRHLEDVRLLPDDDPNLHAVAVAERPRGGRRIDEIDDDVDALLLDAERGHLREAGRLDAANAALERLAAAPLLDQHASVRPDPDGVGRQQVGDHFQCRSGRRPR